MDKPPVSDYCNRCGLLFPLDQLTIVACEGIYCRKCLEMVEAGAETYECDGHNCPPRAHDHKVLV